MSEPLKDADFLDNWIKTQAFKYAFNEKTRGFIGKKFIRERIINTIPREFVARGLSHDRVGLRLTEMLANDLTQSLIRDCDEKRIKANEAEVNASRNLIEKDTRIISNNGVSNTSSPAVTSKSIPYVSGSSGVSHGGTSGKNTAVAPSLPRDSSVGVADPNIPGAPAGITGAGRSGSGGVAGAGIGSIAGRSGQLSGSSGFRGGFGFTASGSGLDKGKKPMTRTTQDEDEDGGIGIPEASGSKHKPMPQSLVASVSDVDRAIADFVAARLPNKASEVRVKAFSKPAVADNSKDIFSRGGSSSPARSESPTSSIFVPAPAPPPLPSDAEIPSLPFKHQHRILTTLQKILECAYYDFARKHYPAFLVRKGWDCPEAGELTQWTRVLALEFRQNPTKAVREAEDLLPALKETDEIRHSAVHRVPISGRDIQRLIKSSSVVVHMLDDTKRMREIDTINAIIERNLQIVHNQRRKKEEKLKAVVEKLHEWKRILEIREVRAVKQAEIEEERIQRSFGDEVGRAIGIEESAESVTGTDVESLGSGNRGLEDEEGVPARCESGVERNVEDSIPEQQEEEYFHESEVWPADVDVDVDVDVDDDETIQG